MSILKRIKKQETEGTNKLFAVVAGPRLGGKTTLAGTLPGKTLLLQAAVLESGSRSAKALAAELGNDLMVLNFATAEELLEIIKELRADSEFDNVYLDGLSALTELKYKDPKITAAIKRNTWDGFRDLGDVVADVLFELKKLVYTEAATKPKNVFVTCALRVKTDANGGVVDVELDTKGRMAVTAITKLGETVLTVLPPITGEDGQETGHRLLTKSQDCWPARVDGILRDQNPGMVCPADLGQILQLAGIE